MFSVTKLVVTTIVAYTAMAKPTLPIPASGKYRIQNAATGLFMDAANALQTAGNPIIVQTLNQPLTANQEWTLSVFGGQFATLTSISSFAVDALDSDGGLVMTVNPTTGSEFELIPVPGGVQICIFPTAFGCLTSPSTPVTQIPVLPMSSDLNQTWIFEVVG